MRLLRFVLAALVALQLSVPVSALPLLPGRPAGFRPGLFSFASGVFSRRTPPPFFLASGPLPVKLVYNASGTTGATRYSTNYNPASWRDTGTNYYVGPATAGCSDSNTGLSQAQCLLTPAAAITLAPAGSQIIMLPGVFNIGSTALTIAKNLSFIAQTPNTVYIGPFLTSASIGSITTASGSNTVALADGNPITGFIDRTQFYPSNLGGSPIVAKYCANTACTATNLTAGRASIIFSYVPGTVYSPGSPATPSVLQTSNARTLIASDFDGNILAWEKDSPPSFTITTGARFYSSGIYWVSGAEDVIGAAGAAATFVLDGGGRLGQGSTNGTTEGDSHDDSDQSFKVFGSLIANNAAVVGANIPHQDGIDFSSTLAGYGILINTYLGQQGVGAAGDQGLTMHAGYGVLFVSSTFFDNGQNLGNVSSVLHGVFNSTVYGGSMNMPNGPAPYGTEEYQFADTNIIGPVATTYSNAGTIIDYDNTFLANATPSTWTGTVENWTGLSDPSGDAILSQITIDMAHTFTDANCTTPVTAGGQTVLCIQDVANPAYQYKVVRGTFTYLDGAHPSLTAVDGSLKIAGRTDTFGSIDILAPMLTSDTSFDLISASVNTTQVYAFGMSWSSGVVNWQNPFAGLTPSSKVDNATALTTKTALMNAITAGCTTKAVSGPAVLTGCSPHILSVENADLYNHMFNLPLIFNSGPSLTITYAYSGEFYGLIIQRHTGNAAFFTANYNTMKAAAGM